MVEAASGEEALKVMSETDYGGSIAELDRVHDFEIILQEELKRTFALVKQISPQPHLIDLMGLKYDLHNLKVLFKAKYLGKSGDDILFPVGTIPLDKLKAMMAGDDFQDLPPSLRMAAEQVAEEFVISRDPQVIDLLLDRAYYDTLITMARKERIDILEGLFVREVDLTNIKTFLRVKRMGRNRDFFKKAFLPHGNITVDFFLGLLDEPLEILAERLAMSDYATVVSEGVREWQEKGTITRLEKLSDDFITAYLQQGKARPFGLEPLIGYLHAKDIEIRNIRMIMVGKINGLPIEAIRERLRDVYL